jgi:hypothetical protein
LIEVEDSGVPKVQTKTKPGSFNGNIVDTAQVVVGENPSLRKVGMEHVTTTAGSVSLLYNLMIDVTYRIALTIPYRRVVSDPQSVVVCSGTPIA